MYVLSKLSLFRLMDVHPDLVKVIKTGITNSPYDFTVVQGVRTAQYQNELYQQGRTTKGDIVTNCDGYKKKSNHQAKNDGYGYAVDIGIYNPNVKGKIEWDNLLKINTVSQHLLKVSKELGVNVEWGGNWLKFKDRPHFELKK